MTFDIITNKLRMKELIHQWQRIIGKNDSLGWLMTQRAGRIFEQLCIPGKNTMPDSPEMDRSELYETAAMWALFNNVSGQAEDGGQYHHDYATAISVALVATAKILKDQPLGSDNVIEFEKMTGIAPKQFMEEFA